MSDPSTESDTSNASIRPESGSMILFVLGAIVVAAGLGLLAAHAPARVRLLGLFSLGLGFLTGWLLAGLAARLQLRLGRVQLVIVALATSGGLITSVCRTVMLQPVNRKADAHPVAEMVEAQLRKPAQSDLPVPQAPLLAAPTLQATPRPFADRLQTYLSRRVEMLGNWPTPLPELFWALELLLGTAGAVWIASRCQAVEAQT